MMSRVLQLGVSRVGGMPFARIEQLVACRRASGRAYLRGRVLVRAQYGSRRDAEHASSQGGCGLAGAFATSST